MKYPIIFSFLSIINFQSFGQNDTFYYDNIYPYHDGFSLITLNGKFGIINSEFEEVIPPVLETINNYDLSDYFFHNKLYGVLNNSTILFDTLGNRIKAYGDPNVYPQRTIKSYDIDSLSVFGVRGGKGCSTPDGKLIIPHENIYIYEGVDDQIIACKEVEIDSFDTNGRWFPYDKKISLVYDRKGNALHKQDGRIFSWKQAGIYFIENFGKYIIANSQFETIHSESLNHIAIMDSLCWIQTNLGWGLINTNFEYILNPQFSYLYVNPYWCVIGNGQKFGFVSRGGVQISEIEYYGEWKQYTGDDTIIVAYKNDHLTFLNIQGECIYNCDEPTEILKRYTNGNKMVEGNFKNYWKTGIWSYYRNDSLNSVWRTIEYSDSSIIYSELDSTSQVIDKWKEKRILAQ